MDAWLKVHPDPRPDSWLFPINGRQANPTSIRTMRLEFARRHGLPWLTSKDFRHFGVSVWDEIGYGESPLAYYWRGHKIGRTMGNEYASRPVEETFVAQLSILPNGPIGVFAKKADASTVDRTKLDALASIAQRLDSGELDVLDAARELKALKSIAVAITR